jgi:site-specific DNA recombinase
MALAVLYTRVSTEEQAKTGMSLKSQEKACREFAAINNFEVAEVFTDEGASAKTADRKELLNLISYCKEHRGQIDGLIVWKVDRFARRAEDHLSLKTVLARFGVRLYSVTEPLEDSTTGRLMETVLAAFAEFDNEIRAERSKGGTNARIEQGGWPFYAPLGYINIKDSLNRPTLKKDPLRAQLVQQLFDEYISGNYTQRQITRYAHSIGLRSRKNGKLAVQTIVNMLKNIAYISKVESPSTGKIIPALHQPLITLSTFNKAQEVLNGKSNNYVKQKDAEWPLRAGFLICARCHSPITGSKPRGRNKSYPKYNCPRCRSSIVKQPVSVDRDLLHQDFQKLLEQIKPKPAHLELFRTIVLRKWNDEYKAIKQRKTNINKDLEELTSKRDRILDLYIDGKLSDHDQNIQLSKLDTNRTILKLQESELVVEINDKESIIDIATDFMANTSTYWSRAPLNIQRRFQNLIFPDGIEYEFGVGFRTPKLSHIYEVIKRMQPEDVQYGTRGRI